MTQGTQNAQTSATERQLKLALFVREHGPVSRRLIQDALVEYAPSESADEKVRRREDESLRRKFERDKAELAAFGLIIRADEEGLYSLDEAASTCAPLELADSEAALLRVSCAALLQDQDYAFKDELRCALAKMSSEIEAPDLLPQWFGAERAEVGVAQKRNALVAGTLRKIRVALGERRMVSFVYEDAQGAASKRCVEPVGCFSLDGTLYLGAVEEGQRRTFRLDRMGKVNGNGPELTTEPFPFHREEWLIHSFQAGPAALSCKVRFAPKNAWQAPGLTGGKGTLEPAQDGGVIWSIDATSAQELASWCVARGAGIAPVEPAEAVEAYRTGLQRVLEVCA